VTGRGKLKGKRGEISEKIFRPHKWRKTDLNGLAESTTPEEKNITGRSDIESHNKGGKIYEGKGKGRVLPTVQSQLKGEYTLGQ